MSTENKYNDEAKQKVKSLVDEIKVAMMVTNLGSKPLSTVPMTTQKTDVEGNIWFLSAGDSDHNKDISSSKATQLLYSKPGDMKFLSVYGEAEIVLDESVLKDLYNNMADNWFDGVEDPNLTAIKFVPKEAYYWDTKANKFVTLFKLGVSSVTGKNKDIGEKGKLDL